MSGVTIAQLQTVVESIIEQRLESDGDVFVYDPNLIKKKLQETKDYATYGITIDTQKTILDKLAGDGSIELDYLEDSDTNGQRWKYGHKWSISHLIPYVKSGDDVLLQFFNIFINLKFDQIRTLKIRYNLPFDATLHYSGGRFTIHCDNGKYELSTLKGGSTVSVLEYAWEHANRLVTRDELNKELSSGKPGKKSIKSIFKENKTVLKDLLEPFITITSDGIRIDTQANIPYKHLCKIISYTINKGRIR